MHQWHGMESCVRGVETEAGIISCSCVAQAAAVRPVKRTPVASAAARRREGQEEEESGR